MSELAKLRGLYHIGNIEDWSGTTEYEIAELLGQALEIADQQAARIAELENTVASLRLQLDTAQQAEAETQVIGEEQCARLAAENAELQSALQAVVALLTPDAEYNPIAAREIARQAMEPVELLSKGE